LRQSQGLCEVLALVQHGNCRILVHEGLTTAKQQKKLGSHYLIMTKKLFSIALGLMLAGFSLTGWAASSKTAKAPPAPPAKTTRSNTIAKNPYLGAIVVDAASGRVLFEEHADAKGYPASVLKLMDLLIILEKIEAGQLSLQDQVPVSAKASQTGGSQVYLAEKESFPVDDMLYALMVQSANDAAVALAERVAGSTEAFTELMNAKAKSLGMTSTVFHSVHGLPPGKGQEHDVTTARDLSVLCRELLKHEQTLRYTSTRERPFRPEGGKKTVVMRTHNHLLGHVAGCDGLKTGFINASGYSIAVTAARNGQRLIVIVLDSADRALRDNKAKELLAKGFSAAGATADAAPATQAAAAGQTTRKKK
jgi:serine-type D-Ala-D-Ala carboxypeptidase (penicillin-binding protein 5/6)